MELSGLSALDKISKAPRSAFYVCHGDYEFLNCELARGISEWFFPDEAERQGSTLRFDWSEGEKAIDAWVEAVGTPSLFGGDQLLIVSNAQAPALRRREDAPSGAKAKAAKEGDKYTNWGSFSRFQRALESPLDGVSTVFICNETLKSVATAKGTRSEKFLQKMYFQLNERGVVVSFPKMWDNNIVDWAASRVRMAGLSIQSETAEFLVHWSGNDLRHIANEVDKLATYLGDGAAVTEEHVRLLVTSSQDQFIFQMFDAAMEGRGNEALRLLEAALRGSAEPLQIVASLGMVMRDTWQARRLLDKGYFRKIGDTYMREKNAIVAEMAKVTTADREEIESRGGASIATTTAMKCFFAVKRGKRLSLDTIERIMARLLEIDSMFKGIKTPKRGTDEIILEQLMSDLSQAAKRGAAPTPRGRR